MDKSTPLNGEDAFAADRLALRTKTLDAKHVPKHLPDTPQALRTVGREGAAHVFVDEHMMQFVISAIMERGNFLGEVRGFQRWGLWFSEIIGYRIDKAGTRIPLHYGELKIEGDSYHAVPRTKPSQ